MSKKYSIFISSTYKDLKEYRKSVHDAILKDGHFPVAMENFLASDKDQWKTIEKLIEECDYYVLILGFKYGTIDSIENISYTEKEYEYALSLKKPILTFLLEKGFNRIKEETEEILKNKIYNFRKKVQNNNMLACKCNDKNNLSSDIISALHKQFEENPQIGWIRTDNIKSDSVNSIFCSNIFDETEYRGINDEVIIHGYIDQPRVFHEWTQSITWKNLFFKIADELFYNKSEYSIKFGLEFDLNSVNGQYLGQSNCEKIHDNDFRKIAKRFKDWGLISIKKSLNQGGKMSLFWSITEKGEQFIINADR
ncbi:MAG: DUF4062 domain-containing protein [Aliarcobacter sp.]|nr:DUF4062 domain-containing protein [Aliarcobacter sp.]